MKKYLCVLLFVLTPLTIIAQTAEENPFRSTFKSLMAIEEVVFGDFDNDGQDEKIVVSKEPMASVGFVAYLDEINSDESETIGIFSTGQAVDIFVMKQDADQDNDLDLIITARDSTKEQGETKIFKLINDGKGNFKIYMGL